MRRRWVRWVSVALLSLVAGGAAADAPVAFQRQYATLPQGQVHVLSSRPALGKPSHSTVACFSPNPASGNYFRLFMAELGRDRVMVAPDYPGLGQSDPMEAVRDIGDYADVMAATLEAVGYGSEGDGALDICGYHTGAFVALELAVRRPDLVRRLILLGIPYYSGPEREAMYRKNVVERPLTESFEQLRDSWDFAVTNRAPGVRLDRAYANFLDAARARPVRHRAYHAAFTYPAAEQAAKVTQPVLILNPHGSLAEESRALAPAFPDATLVELPELHHGVFDVGAAVLAARARDFLDAP